MTTARSSRSTAAYRPSRRRRWSEELWSRRPELERLLMARTGNFTENGTTRHSHALAIAQLLLTYPVLRAKHTRKRSGSTIAHAITTLSAMCALGAALPAQRPTGFLDRTVTRGALTMKHQVYVPNTYDGHRWIPVSCSCTDPASVAAMGSSRRRSDARADSAAL